MSGKKTGQYVNCTYCGKKIYRTKYRLEHSQHHFCNHDCELAWKDDQSHETRMCGICGKSFRVAKGSTKFLCSWECQHQWQTQQVGLLNARCTSIMTPCDSCGELFLEKQYHLRDNAHHFCSTKCRQKWYAEVWSQAPEWREQSRRRAVQLLQTQPITTQTKPQLRMNELLNQLEIAFINEQPMVYYSIDNYLIDYHLAIEVMGDYWHCSPVRYNSIRTKQQLKVIRRDKAKRSYLRKYHQLETLYLWENDILNNADLCCALILEFINNHGVLSNYHSFNYEIVDDTLQLKTYLIRAYQEMTSQEVQSYVQIAV